MISLVIAIVACLAFGAIIASSPRRSRSIIGRGLLGLMGGFLLGIVAGFVISATHWFGPVAIPNPVFNFPGFATTLSSLCPLIFGLVGLIVGITLSLIKRQN